MPIDREVVGDGNLHDHIYEALREALCNGILIPGQVVSYRDLAQRFGVSLIPVRDALKRLVAERGLEMLENRTVRVPVMTRHRFQELLQVRLSPEAMLARQATERIDPLGIAELEAINAEMQASVRADDVKTYLSANQRFHFHFYAVADSDVNFPIVQSLWMQAGPFLNGVFTSTGTKNARDNHQEILKALRRRDHIAASHALCSDLADAADAILARGEFFANVD